MTLKIFQLNMWAGSRFSALKEFLEHNSFDILCFEEVSGIGATSGNILSSRESFKMDCFVELQKVLGEGYAGELAISQYLASNPKTAYFGNAIFYKKDFTLTQTDILVLHKNEVPFSAEQTGIEELGRNALHLTLQKEGKTIDVIAAHLAWAKTKEEQPHQRVQNLKLIDYMQHMQKPWVLAGDFNIDLHQQSVVDLEKFGRNLTKEYNVANTIDPTNHRNWEKIKPGFAIDFIFVSPDVKVVDFTALDTIHLSDHIGLNVVVEV